MNHRHDHAPLALLLRKAQAASMQCKSLNGTGRYCLACHHEVTNAIKWEHRKSHCHALHSLWQLRCYLLADTAAPCVGCRSLLQAVGTRRRQRERDRPVATEGQHTCRPVSVDAEDTAADDGVLPRSQPRGPASSLRGTARHGAREGVDENARLRGGQLALFCVTALRLVVLTLPLDVARTLSDSEVKVVFVRVEVVLGLIHRAALRASKARDELLAAARLLVLVRKTRPHHT
mmetsp:Transcript_7761/g.19816  ORF Transcript_7761/g.19816 Transcript_7761/m.19816 type:complete len:233 (+) Transcript_7761:54-752(+)